MCGRFVSSQSMEELAEIFAVEAVGEQLPEPSYHVHPTDAVRVVLDSAKTSARRLEGAVWALARPRQAELVTRPPLINVRVETAARSFGYALRAHRAIVPADSYWEWRSQPGAARGRPGKTPFSIAPAAGSGPLALAGLYSWWVDPRLPEDDPGRFRLTVGILTTAPTPGLAQIHDRMPLALAPELWDDWLDPARPGDESLLAAAVATGQAVAEALEWHEVRPFRGSDDGPELTRPL